MFPVAKILISRTLVVIFWGIVAIIVPKFGLFLDFIGAFSGTVLCFVLPVLYYNKAFKDEITKWRLAINYSILIVGSVFGGVSAVASFFAILAELI